MRPGVAGIRLEPGAELALCGIEAAGSKLLPATANVRRRSSGCCIAGSCVRRRLRYFGLQLQSDGVEFRLDALQSCESVALGITLCLAASLDSGFETSHRECVGAERFLGCFSFLLGLFFLPRLFQRLNQQRAVFRIVRRTPRCFAEITRSRGEMAGAQCEQAEVEWRIGASGLNLARSA